MSNMIGGYYVGDNTERNVQPLSGGMADVKGQLEGTTPVPTTVMGYNQILCCGKALCISIDDTCRGFNSPSI